MLALPGKVYTLLKAAQDAGIGFGSATGSEGTAMGYLTTHVLDTAHGCPAAGMHATLFRIEGGAPRKLMEADLDADGRFPGRLLEGEEFEVGRYRLVFEVAAYFHERGAALAEPPFLETVPIDFGIAAPDEHYHVPLLVSPWSYSTYRGS